MVTRAESPDPRIFRALAQSTRDFVVALDLDLVVLFANPAAAVLVGLDPEAMSGRPFGEFVPPGEIELVREALAAVRASGEAVSVEQVVELPVGRLWLERHIIPIPDEAGRLTGILGITRDVTARHEAQEAALRHEAELARRVAEVESELLARTREAEQQAEQLRVENRHRREAEAELRTLLDEAPDAVLVADHTGRLILVSRHACELFGYTQDEFQALTVEDLMPEARRARHRAHREAFLVDARRRPMGAGLQLDARRKDGTVFQADISLSPVDSAGRPRVLAIVRDVTEQRRLLREVELARRLESVARLAGGVAHDFNNMMTLIIGYAELLRDQTPAGDTRHKPLGHILDAADRAARVTDQLFAFSKHLLLRPEPVDLHQVLRAALEEHRRSAPRGIPYELEAGADGTFVLDGGALRGAVSALLANASEAIERRGRLGGMVRLVSARVERPAGKGGPAATWLAVTVEDDGCGMDQATLDRALEPFFTTKGLGLTAGLGLPTVHGFATQSGGSVELESEPGEGTRATILLPLAD